MQRALLGIVPPFGYKEESDAITYPLFQKRYFDMNYITEPLNFYYSYFLPLDMQKNMLLFAEEAQSAQWEPHQDMQGQREHRGLVINTRGTEIVAPVCAQEAGELRWS